MFHARPNPMDVETETFSVRSVVELFREIMGFWFWCSWRERNRSPIVYSCLRFNLVVPFNSRIEGRFIERKIHDRGRNPCRGAVVLEGKPNIHCLESKLFVHCYGLNLNYLGKRQKIGPTFWLFQFFSLVKQSTFSLTSAFSINYDTVFITKLIYFLTLYRKFHNFYQSDMLQVPQPTLTAVDLFNANINGHHAQRTWLGHAYTLRNHDGQKDSCDHAKRHLK